MDNVCHTLAGAALGEAGLKHKTAYGMATLLVASNLPDVDVAVFLTDTLAMSFRRGWTHGVLAMAVLPGVFAAGMWIWGRRRLAPAPAPGTPPLRLKPLLVLAYGAVWLHIFMDWLNSYGIRLLMPFSERWFYGDALYIVDPVLYVVFGAGVVLARRAAARKQAAPWRPARRSLAAAAIYVGLMLGGTWWARSEVRGELRRAGAGEARFMVTPLFARPLSREVIVDTGPRYEKGLVWFEPAPRFRPLGYGVETMASHPAAQAAAARPRVRAFLGWSRFPFFVIEPDGAGVRVFVNDYRYTDASGRVGWAGQEVWIRD